MFVNLNSPTLKLVYKGCYRRLIVVSSDYNTTNIFSFNTSGATVASSTGPSESTTYTASYIANIDGDTAAGEYSTVVTYVITASY